MHMSRLAVVPFLVAAPLAAQAQVAYRTAADAPSPLSENVAYAYADVLRVDPVFETVRYREPREECYDETVERVERGGGDPTGGTVLGAIIGGAIGNQVGKGNGRNK